MSKRITAIQPEGHYAPVLKRGIQYVIDHQKAAIEQVATQDGHLLIEKCQPARLDDVNPWKIEQSRICNFQAASIGIDLERGHLLEAE